MVHFPHVLYLQIVVLVGDVLGEYAAALNPIPEYIEDPDILESDGRPVRYHDIVQDNYAKTLQGGQVVRTYYPETREGVQNIVRMAAKKKARVRASGAKHSWNHWVWGVDNQYEEAEPNPCYDKKYTGDVDYFIAMVISQANLYFSVRCNNTLLFSV